MAIDKSTTMKIILTIVISLAIGQLSVAQKVYPTKKYALINAQVVDIESENISPGTIMINNGIIEEVRTTGGEIESSYEIIDLENAFVMPGMIDVHTHLNNLAAAKRALMSGVTTVRSASVPAFQDVSISEMVKHGQLDGPGYDTCRSICYAVS